jgi:hypothetical protein
MMNRIESASGPVEIDEKTYWYFLETLPPRFMRENYFCFAEGSEAIRKLNPLVAMTYDRACCVFSHNHRCFRQ